MRHRSFAIVACALVLATSAPAAAATLTVTSLADDGSPGTLRSQLAAASPGDRIEFAVTGSIVLGSSLVVSTSNLTIAGAGRDLLTLDGGGVDRVVSIASGATAVEIRDLAIENGDVAGVGDGGGVHNAGGLTLRHVRIANNTANSGGGIYSSGTLGLNDVVIEANATGLLSGGSSRGGGLLNDGGIVSGAHVVMRGHGLVSDSFLEGAIFANDGGDMSWVALDADDFSEYGTAVVNSAGSVALTSSTVRGGCYFTNQGTLTISQSTVRGIACESAGFTSSGILRLADVDIGEFYGYGSATLTNAGTAVIERSLVHDFYGVNLDGGVANLGSLLIVNSTISETAAEYGTSGRRNFPTGVAEIYSSTISGYTGDPAAVVVENEGSLTLRNVLIETDSISFGTACNPSTSASIVDLDGNSLAGDASCTSLATAPLLLAPLADNGGPTRTHALLPGSPALDRAATCTYDDDMDDLTPEVPVQKDQRGMLRFGGAACDAGAFEDEAVPVPALPFFAHAMSVLAIGALASLSARDNGTSDTFEHTPGCGGMR